MPRDLLLERDGVRLAGVDFAGNGPAVLLLHGLAGYGGEWTQTAGWLRERARVVAPDARGHGRSERRPDDVSRAAHLEELGASLRRWPVPFASHEAAVEFFGGPSLRAEAWAEGLERREDGWWPRFDVEVMMRTLAEADRRDYWQAWERIACPTLVVRGGDGSLSRADAEPMVARGRRARLVEVADAGHDVHLDQPDGWRAALSEFLDSLEAERGAAR